jgi:hypothetical protein
MLGQVSCSRRPARPTSSLCGGSQGSGRKVMLLLCNFVIHRKVTLLVRPKLPVLCAGVAKSAASLTML